jgi:penicillin-binding protein 2
MEKATSRLRILALLVVLMFLALSTRLWFLQVLATQRFDKEATRNSVRWVYSEPLRGLIYDTTGERVLVDNQQSLEVRITPDLLGDQGESVVLQVSKLTGVPVREIVRTLQDTKFVSSQAIPVAEFVPKEVQFYIREHPEEFPGVQVDTTYVRSYPYGRMAAHLFGYTGLIDAARLEELKGSGYGPNDIVGISGLEAVYEEYLHGKQGKQKLIVNSDGELIRALGKAPPTAGADLQLTLDVHMQRVAERALASGMERARGYRASNGSYLEANAGVVVVLDANSGGIVAMASSPSYDPSWYVHGLTREQNRYLNNSRRGALQNRAVQLSYMPGSTFKPVTGLAAIKEGFATESGYYPCDGTYVVPGDKSGTVFHNWTEKNLHAMTIAEALRVSCDTVFDAFGARFYRQYVDNQFGENADHLERDLHEWGFELPTGVDLPAETTGLVPDPAWASEPEQNCKTCPFPFGWVPGGDILTMIGSGYVEVTPLQLARAYAAIANGGQLCQPHLVDQIIPSTGSTVKRVGGHCDENVVPYSDQQLGYIRGALRSAVESGTAACAFGGFPTSTIAVAGKTGTAVRGEPYQDTSWFASMVGPDPDHPEYVIVTMVEQGGFGGETAAPITREVIDGLYPDQLANDTHPICHLEDG